MIFTLFILLPILFVVGMVVFGLIVGRRSRQRMEEEEQESFAKKDAIENTGNNSAKWATKNAIDTFRKFEEFIIDDFLVCEGEELRPSCAIDLIFFSKKGIFVIKCVDDEGSIVGDATGDYWMLDFKKQETAFKNPIKANEYLVKKIANITNQFTNVNNLIVFTRADTERLVNHNNQVVELGKIRHYFESLNDVYDDTEIPFLYNTVKEYIDNHS